MQEVVTVGLNMPGYSTASACQWVRIRPKEYTERYEAFDSRLNFMLSRSLSLFLVLQRYCNSRLCAGVRQTSVVWWCAFCTRAVTEFLVAEKELLTNIHKWLKLCTESESLIKTLLSR